MGFDGLISAKAATQYNNYIIGDVKIDDVVVRIGKEGRKIRMVLSGLLNWTFITMKNAGRFICYYGTDYCHVFYYGFVNNCIILVIREKNNLNLLYGSVSMELKDIAPG